MSLEEYGYTLTSKDKELPWNPTEYVILYENSGSASFGRENSQGTVTYLCEYFDVGQFIDVVMGKTVMGEGGLLKRSASSPTFDGTQGSTPQAHPWWENYYAASASIEPVGKVIQSNGKPVYQKAKVTVAFRPNPFNIIPDDEYDDATEINRYVSKTPEATAEFQTSQGVFKFVTDPQHRPLDIQPGFIIAAQRFTYTWHQVPVVLRDDGQPDLGSVPNIATLLPLVGSLNEVEFDGFAPGTVLFTSFTPKLILPQLASSNSYYWDISYSIGVRDYGESTTPVVTDERIGWNYAFDPTRGVWDLYTDTGTESGRTMYPYADLNPLFEANW